MWSLKTTRLFLFSGSLVLGLAIGGGVEAAIGHSEVVAGLFGGAGLGMILSAWHTGGSSGED